MKFEPGPRAPVVVPLHYRICCLVRRSNNYNTQIAGNKHLQWKAPQTYVGIHASQKYERGISAPNTNQVDPWGWLADILQ